MGVSVSRVKLWVLFGAITLLYVTRENIPASPPALAGMPGFAGMRTDRPPAKIDWRLAMRARARVVRVVREGRYIVAVKPLLYERRRSYRSTWRPGYNRESLALARTPALRAVLQINAYDLVAGCELELRLSGRGMPRALPAGSYGEYLRERGILFQLRLSRRYHVRELNCSRPTLGGRLHLLIRTSLQRDAGLDYRDPRYGLILALLLGNSAFLQKDLKDCARDLGVLHLFAASGLHLGIFYACLFWPLSRLFGKKDPRALFAPLGPCLGYLLALDVPVSLLRAFCFLTIHALQSLTHRHVPVRELLVNTALLVLCLAPGDFLSPGTALSFGAVGGILYFYRVIETTVFAGDRWRGLAGHAAVSLAAGIWTTPIIVFVFGQHPALSLLANLLLVPLVGLLLPACALVFGVGMFWNLAGGGPLPGIMGTAWIFWPVGTGFDFFVYLCRELAQVDHWLAPGAPDSLAFFTFGARVRYVPLLANALLFLTVWWMRGEQLRCKRAERALPVERVRLARRIVWPAILLLGPPGAWLEYGLRCAFQFFL